MKQKVWYVDGNKIKKKSRKKAIIISSILGFALLLTGAIVVSGSQSDWLTEISRDAANDISNAGNTTTDTLLTDVDTKIKNKVIQKADPVIEEKMRQLQAELQAYFDAKLNDVTDTAEYDAVIADLERIKGVMLDNYKREIDAAFQGQ
jgi:hypothetical protein